MSKKKFELDVFEGTVAFEKIILTDIADDVISFQRDFIDRSTGFVDSYFYKKYIGDIVHDNLLYSYSTNGHHVWVEYLGYRFFNIALSRLIPHSEIILNMVNMEGIDI